jgi:PhzF family phenazine biosynthesis protein
MTKLGISKINNSQILDMNKNKIYQVDSFTGVPFKGNPAGVMIVDENTSTEFMQNIALEMNLSETAFLIPYNDDFNIRYFTPSKEVPLCGHATLASAHIVYELGLKRKSETITFHAKGGDLTISFESDLIMMNFPVYTFIKIEWQKDFVNAIGFQPIEIYSSLYDWIILVAETEKEIQNAVPNYELMIKNGLGHLMITAQSKSENIDFVLRCFAPVSGINEDPVTGSAHCALTPLWAEKLNKTELNSFQLSKRTGELKTQLMGDRVLIKGKAVTIFESILPDYLFIY